MGDIFGTHWDTTEDTTGTHGDIWGHIGVISLWPYGWHWGLAPSMSLLPSVSLPVPVPPPCLLCPYSPGGQVSLGSHQEEQEAGAR